MDEGLKVKVPKARRKFLDITEIQKRKNVNIPPDKPGLGRDRDLFLFQVYTGYNFKRLFVFKKDQLQNDHKFVKIILEERDNNGNQTIIPLFKFPYAKTVLERYESGPTKKLVFDKKHLV